MEIEQTTTVSLSDLYRKMLRKELILPDHQRSNVWSNSKKEGWYRSIRKTAEKGGTVAGLITIYRLASAPRKTTVREINDGAQRIYFGLTGFKETCKNLEEFERIISNCYISVQSAVYDDLDEAINEFINLNKGTICTPYELTTGIFVSQLSDANFSTTWVPLRERLYRIIAQSLMTAGAKNDFETGSRETQHKRRRDSHVLLYLFLKDKPAKIRYEASVGYIRDWNSQTRVETYLAKLFKEKGLNWVSKQLDSFKGHLDRAAAFYLQHWVEYGGNFKAPSSVHVRWWFQAYTLLKKENFHVQKIKEFTIKFIERTEGRSTLYYTNDDEESQKHCSIGMSDMSRLTGVFRYLDMDYYADQKVRPKEKGELKQGFVKSHVNAFSAHGDGETLPENALENAHRSARDMTKEEEDKLRKLQFK